jgi:hypothetical protein
MRYEIRVCVCVCLLLQDLVQRCIHGGGGGYGRTCATRDDEPRPVWTSLPITHSWFLLLCFITACLGIVYY